jgi:hypothetical protein
MLALPASTLYEMEKDARSRSEPGSRKDSASNVCVQRVREGSTMAKNLETMSVPVACREPWASATYLIWFCSVDNAMSSHRIQ